MLADTVKKSKPSFRKHEGRLCVCMEQIKDWESLNDLPIILKMLIVIISAKPLSSVHPLCLPPLMYISWCALSISAGVLTSSLGLDSGGTALLLVPCGWILTVHGVRLLRLTLQHAAAHNSVLSTSKANLILGEISSILTISTDFRTYGLAHRRTHHNAQKLMTPGDETYEFWTKDLRLSHGASLKDSQQLVVQSLCSPYYHLRRFSNRASVCFASSSLLHNVWSISFWSLILCLVTCTGNFRLFLISWLIPISVLFECCSVLRQIVEHRNPTDEEPRMTAAIYLADLPPSTSAKHSNLKRCALWAYWWFKLLTVHLLCRLLVLPGDSPNHPKHHNAPESADWRNHIYVQSERFDYPENFGLASAMLDSLRSWS